jgi:hypothetical protein
VEVIVGKYLQVVGALLFGLYQSGQRAVPGVDISEHQQVQWPHETHYRLLTVGEKGLWQDRIRLYLQSEWNW